MTYHLPTEYLGNVEGERPYVWLSHLCGVPKRRAEMWLRDGFDEATADLIATRLWLHPTAIWPEWRWDMPYMTARRLQAYDHALELRAS